MYYNVIYKILTISIKILLKIILCQNFGGAAAPSVPYKPMPIKCVCVCVCTLQVMNGLSQLKKKKLLFSKCES